MPAIHTNYIGQFSANLLFVVLCGSIVIRRCKPAFNRELQIVNLPGASAGVSGGKTLRGSKHVAGSPREIPRKKPIRANPRAALAWPFPPAASSGVPWLFPMDQESDVMTLQQVAEYLQLSEMTIYRMAREGRLPGIKIGRLWRFRRADIERWMEERTGGF